MRVRVPDLVIPNSSFNHHKKMPANKNAMPGPSTTKQTAADLEAELAAMEEEEAVEAKRRQEREEKMAEEVRELEKENKVFLEFCREYKKGQEEEQVQVQVQEQEQEQEQGQEAE